MEAPERVEAPAANLATRGERFGAYIGDSLLQYAIALGLIMGSEAAPEPLATAMIVAGLVAYLLYEPATMALMRGATPAKKGLDIWVCRADGQPAGFWLGLGRSILKNIIGTFIVVDGIFVLARDDRRSLHDLMCGTTVRRRVPETRPAAAGTSFANPVAG